MVAGGLLAARAQRELASASAPDSRAFREAIERSRAAYWPRATVIFEITTGSSGLSPRLRGTLAILVTMSVSLH
jgi:hypothetical protein